MIKVSVRKYHKLVAAFCLMVGVATGAVAQNKNVQFPAGLKWQVMHYASFNFNYDDGPIDAKKKVAAYTLWKMNLDAMKQKQKPLPVFVLMSSPYRSNYIFSMIDSADEACERPGNGVGMVDMYPVCSMSIFKVDATPVKVKVIQGMCFLHFNDSDYPTGKYHTEFAFDEEHGIAYFRIIQHGVEVPDCNRMLRFP